MEYLIVVDMQNDFIDGSLGTSEAVKIVPNVVDKIKKFQGKIIYTKDTHTRDYLNTQEGKKLPIEHCIVGTIGHEFNSEIQSVVDEDDVVIEKPTFGSRRLGEILTKENEKERISKIDFVGLCTDICVISNALLVKGFLPEIPIYVDASCCAGVTPESHDLALRAMQACQINIE